MPKPGVGKCCSSADLPSSLVEEGDAGLKIFPRRLCYGGICCLITVTVILSINKTLYNTVIFSLLLTNTEVLLIPEFAVRHSFLFLLPSLPFYPAVFFSVPWFQREAGNKSSWQLSCHPPFSSPGFLPLYLMESVPPGFKAVENWG